MKKIGRIVVFLLLSGILIEVMNQVFTPKWETDGRWEPATQIIDGFYAEKKDTIDVLYLGSSNSFYDINPLIVYEEQGITGYVLGSGEQRLFTSYYYLQEALRKQKPKVVVLDALGLFYQGSGEEEQSRKAYDYMKFSGNKIQSLKMAAGEEGDIFSYVFPFSRYHARWTSLNERDFLYPVSDKHYPLKGYAYSETVAEELPDFNMESIIHEGMSISRENEFYFNEIHKLCRENNITLVLIKTPNIEWGMIEHSQTEKLSQENNLDFYDYNTFMGQIGISEKDCFLDGAHLNYKGAEKLSAHLGEIVAEYVPAEQEKDEDVKKQWEEDFEYYLEQRRQY